MSPSEAASKTRKVSMMTLRHEGDCDKVQSLIIAESETESADGHACFREKCGEESMNNGIERFTDA